jgi:hypothetical protein
MSEGRKGTRRVGERAVRERAPGCAPNRAPRSRPFVDRDYDFSRPAPRERELGSPPAGWKLRCYEHWRARASRGVRLRATMTFDGAAALDEFRRMEREMRAAIPRGPPRALVAPTTPPSGASRAPNDTPPRVSRALPGARYSVSAYAYAATGPDGVPLERTLTSRGAFVPGGVAVSETLRTVRDARGVERVSVHRGVGGSSRRVVRARDPNDPRREILLDESSERASEDPDAFDRRWRAAATRAGVVGVGGDPSETAHAFRRFGGGDPALGAFGARRLRDAPRARREAVAEEEEEEEEDEPSSEATRRLASAARAAHAARSEALRREATRMTTSAGTGRERISSPGTESGGRGRRSPWG